MPSPLPKSAYDLSLPHFIDYKKEKRTAAIPKNSWGPIFSEWNHYSAVCVCPNGDVLAAWYTTVSEEGRELAQASSRLRAGADRWDDATLFLDVPDVNDHAPVLLTVLVGIALVATDDFDAALARLVIEHGCVFVIQLEAAAGPAWIRVAIPLP